MAACLAVSFLAGANEDYSGRVEVVYWHKWGGYWTSVIEEICGWFNDSQDEIVVKPLLVHGQRAKTKFLASIVGNEPPDLMTEWDPVLPHYAANDVLYPLDDLMAETPGEREALLEYIYPVVRRMSSYNGILYALPFSMNTFCIFYSKEAFAEAGVEKVPETIAELEEAMDKLFVFDRRGYIERSGFELGAWQARMIFPAFGGRFYDEETGRFTCDYPRNVAALEWMCRIARKYGMKQLQTFNQLSTSYLQGASDPFVARRIAMRPYGQWGVWQIQRAEKDGLPKLDYGVFSVPAPPVGFRNSTHVNGNFCVIPRNARHPREAWHFMKWLAGFGDEATGARVAVRGGWAPASPNVVDEPEYEEFLKENPTFRDFVDLMDSPHVWILPQVPVQSYFGSRLDAAVDYALWGVKTPRKALEDLNREMERESRRTRLDIDARRKAREAREAKKLAAG